MRRPIRGRSAAFDRLLDEDVADGTALARVLAAARAPGTAEDLVGLPAAMSAFTIATRQLPRSPVGHRAAARRPLTARGLLAKTVAAVSGVALAGGVAYAATTAGFIGIGGTSNHPPGSHRTSPGQSGASNGDSEPFGSAGPASVAKTDVGSTGLPSHAVGHPGSHGTQPERRVTVHPTHPASPTHPTSPTRPTRPPSPTHPAPSSTTAPPAHGPTTHPTHPPTPSHPAPPTHPAG